MSVSSSGVGTTVRRIFGRPVVAILSTALVFAVLAVAPLSASGAPSNAKIRALRAEAVTASGKLDDLNAELELKQTDLQAVEEALQGTRADITATEAKLADAQARLEESQATLENRADAIYRNGAADFLTVLLGTADFEDFVTRLDLLNRITSADAELITQVSADRDRVSQARSALLNRESEEVALRAEAQARQRAVEAAVAKQSSYVASLSAEIKKAVKAEEKRLADEAARLARLAEEAASHPSTRPSDAGNLGESHPAAVTAAKRYLGVPYLWGGTTPRGFDCSGLCQYAYAQIGISIPRTSRTQFTSGQFIPPSRTDLLEPGDLVFFGYGGDPKQVHHVGMYVGGGVFIHSPGAGDHVKYSSLTDRISTRRDYVGAVRP
jgi:cell wall-associated NlpC family hydrolase